MAAFDLSSMESLLSSVRGVGDNSKSQNKAQRELTKLQGRLQQELASQQAQYAQQLQAQQDAARLAAQREAQAAETLAMRERLAAEIPLQAGQLIGSYNGHETVAMKQLREQANQFNQQFGEDRRQFGMEFGEEQRQFNEQFGEGRRQFGMEFGEDQRQFDLTLAQQREVMALEREVENRRLSLAELTQQQDNAISQGQLDLARRIETEKVRLQELQTEAQIRLQTAELSGVMDTGQLTEAARAARAREAMEQAQLMGVGTNGQMTDAAQQWRIQAALEAARTNAALRQQSSDYFEAAAYNRDPTVQSTLAFLNAANQGSSLGFRTTAEGVPGTSSMASLTGAIPNAQTNVAGIQGQPASGPSPSLQAAEAARQGAQAAYTTQMHQEAQKMPAVLPGGGNIAPPPSTASVPTGPQQPAVAGSRVLYNANATDAIDPIQQRLQTIQKQIIQPGAHKLAPGTMEAWSPTEKGLIASALKTSGVNPADFEQQYKRARLQTGASALTM